MTNCSLVGARVSACGRQLLNSPLRVNSARRLPVRITAPLGLRRDKVFYTTAVKDVHLIFF